MRLCDLLNKTPTTPQDDEIPIDASSIDAVVSADSLFHSSTVKIERSVRISDLQRNKLEAETDQIFTGAPNQPWEEVCVTPSGAAYQAGAPEFPDGSFIQKLKKRAEQDLYFFAKVVMKRKYLSPHLHTDVCRFLQHRPPFRKGLLLPREHAKTSIVSHSLPPHILIQPAASNCYFPGMEGSDCRILLACENVTRASKHLRVIETAFESNTLLRTLWPHRVWENARRQSKKWSELEMIIPRSTEYPEPSVMAIGVDGAITGARPNVMIKDDLISLEARNSTTVMNSAIDWHIASRALLESYEEGSGKESLEFIIGTRWAVHDLYSYIQKEDPTVEWMVRSVIENGVPIYPEYWNMAKIEQTKREFKSLFPLNYMNSAADPSLVDFDIESVRTFSLDNEGRIQFSFDPRDALLIRSASQAAEIPTLPKGAKFAPWMWAAYFGNNRGEYLRLKYAN